MHLPSSQRRSGVVLLVVLAMLALFSSLALSFVFFADAEAVASLYNLQSQNRDTHDLDPEVLANFFLSEFLYGSQNPYSAMRGHSLAELIHGYNPASLNCVPFNGPGRQQSYVFTPTPPALSPGLNNQNMINYTRYDKLLGGVWTNADGFERTPGFFGDTKNPAYRYAEATNVPWTAYDRHNMFLSMMDVNGNVLLPSFYRPWTLQDPAIDLTPASKNRKFASMRPDGAWHPAFQPGVKDANGNLLMPDSEVTTINGVQLVLDVRNNESGMGPSGANNDSFWMDLGFPVMTAPNGKRYKALFAPLIVDLSNRLHLWAHGNRVAAPAWTNATNYVTGNAVTATDGVIYLCLAPNTNQQPPTSPAYWLAVSGHCSNLGMGPAEVNLGRLPIPLNELQALFNLKYGGLAGSSASVPVGSPVAFPTLRGGPLYSLLDFDGVNTTEHVGSRPPFFNFSVVIQPAIPSPGVQTVKVTLPTGAVPGTYVPVNNTSYYGGYPWCIYKGMGLFLSDPQPQPMPQLSENITIIDVDHVNSTITANFANAHVAGKTLSFGSSAHWYPYYPGGYNNTGGEINNNAHTLRMRNATAPNIDALPASHMEALLRFTGTNSPATMSELMRRMPATFGNPANRNRVTTVNWHPDRIIGSPFLTFNRSSSNFVFKAPTDPYPQILALTPADVTNPASVQTPSDYSSLADWRNTIGSLLRVDLNRRLSDFPTPASQTSTYTTAAEQGQASQAILDRQNLAKDIYNALVLVCGAKDPNVNAGMTIAGADFQAARWLAQLAVNIVDFVDYDDFSTPFRWYNSGATPVDTDFVFGTELPRLVLSEVYAQYDNDPADPMIAAMMKSSYSNLNVWLELDNPLPASPNGGGIYPFDQGNTQLKINGVPVYQVVVYQSGLSPVDNMTNLTANMRSPANPRVSFGEPDSTLFTPLTPVAPTPVKPTDWGTDANLVVKANSVPTLYYLAPRTSFVDPAHNPKITPNAWNPATMYTTGALVSSGNLYYSCIAPNTNQAPPNTSYWIPSGYESPSLTFRPAGTDPLPNSGVTVLLQRLAVPYLPPQPNPALALYNPYITVDYIDNTNPTQPGVPNGIKAFDNRKYNSTTGLIAPPNKPGNNWSYMRKQLYTSHPLQVVKHPATAGNTRPDSNFGATNPGGVRNDWVIHLDRPLVNPLEVLHVSGFRPHEFTQQFFAPSSAAPTGELFQHYAPWLPAKPWYGGSQQTPIYRLLEVLGTAHHSAGTFVGGRVPGKINLNTITDLEIFKALCDAQDLPQHTATNGGPTPNPLFTTGTATTMFNSLLVSRQGFPMTQSDGAPFRPFNDGNIANTWFRPDPSNPTMPLFGLTGQHPQMNLALFQKIYNNIATTSNVFAVWWTVGYFEVVDENFRPAVLGAEIGRAENRHIRHRFFAVVDRSAMQAFNGTTSAVSAGASQTMSVNLNAWNATQNYVNSQPVSYLGNAYICIQANVNTVPTNTSYWQPLLQPGMVFEVSNPTGANWATGTNYAVGNTAVDRGTPYVCIQANTAAGANRPGTAGGLPFWAVPTEAVAVKSVTGTSFTADFTIPHAAGSTIVLRGHPGPKTNYPTPTNAAPAFLPPYNPRQDPEVVLHLSLIQ